MTRAREQEKARLVQYAEQLIEEALDWQGKTDRPNLTQVEDKILELRRKFGQELAREVIEAQETKQPVPEPPCKQCGQEMSYKGQKAVTPQTWLDKVRFERGYYYCERCRVGFFPLDEQLGLVNKRYSLGLEREMVWLSSTEKSFAHAEDVMGRIGHIKVSDSSIWRRKEVWGERIKEQEEAQRVQANTLGRAEAFRARVQGAKQRLGVSMDGTMVHIRKEGWKELKVGCGFEIEVYPTRVRDTGDWEDLAHATHNQYVAHLGGPEVLGQKLWALAKARGWEEACDRQVIGDGAPWIWNVTQDHFYDAQQALDWYHATEHLAGVATLLHGEGTPAAKHWYKVAKTALYQGKAEAIAQKMTLTAQEYPEAVATKVCKEAAYLQTHKRRMQYQELREDKYVIGSGMVESEAKQFKARFCGPGMRWNRSGIERLIPIRAAVMGGTFDSLWHTVCNSPQT